MFRIQHADGITGLLDLCQFRIVIGSCSGQFIDFHGARFMATFHPAYLLRNPNEKRKVWEDMMQVMEKLNLPISEKQRGYFL